MAKEKKELLHIQVKDNGLIISEKIGNALADVRATLERGIIDNLISGANESSLTRYKIAQNIRLREFRIQTDKLIEQSKKSVKKALKKDTTVNLNSKQVNKVSNDVSKGLNDLGNNAIKSYQNTLNSLFLEVKAAKDLKSQLQKHINTGMNIDVVYKDGKTYKFDSYYEMKARTDIQNYIGDNMVKAGSAGGVIFYVAAFFGDCAKDHVDYQGKIYYDKNWRDIAPKDRIDEIEAYIKSNCEMSVQDVMTGKGNYLTTRPNCRHYFQYVDIDSVLGAKTEKEVSDLRSKMNLNFNGKYQPEKYEALQKQRANERMIRAKKEQVTKLEQELALDVGNKELRSRILAGEESIRHYQANQRVLERNFSNIQRSYMREQNGGRVDFGTSKNLTINQNDATIRISKNPNSIFAEINKSTMYYLEPKPLEKELTDNKIISKLMAKDTTMGSCSSLALAYIGNKKGYDVLDFRGGESADFFATPSNIVKLAEQFNGSILKGKNDIEMVKALLENADKRKEYYLMCGEHATIIKARNNKWCYIEMQKEDSKNGMHPLTKESLKERFGCKSRRNVDRSVVMIDANNFEGENFKTILGFINTKKG